MKKKKKKARHDKNDGRIFNFNYLHTHLFKNDTN